MNCAVRYGYSVPYRIVRLRYETIQYTSSGEKTGFRPPKHMSLLLTPDGRKSES